MPGRAERNVIFMANLTIELATGYTFPADDCGVIPHVVSRCDEVATAIDIVGELLEPGALDTMKVYNEDDALLMEYADVLCDSFQCVFMEDVVTLHLYLREGAERVDGAIAGEKASVYDVLFGEEDEE